MNIHATAKPVHGEQVHWQIENLKKHYRGYTTVAPDGCNLTVGQMVHYTNDYGGQFELTVRGFTTNCEPSDNGRTVYIFTDAYWFPVNPIDCNPVKPA